MLVLHAVDVSFPHQTAALRLEPVPDVREVAADGRAAEPVVAEPLKEVPDAQGLAPQETCPGVLTDVPGTCPDAALAGGVRLELHRQDLVAHVRVLRRVAGDPG